MANLWKAVVTVKGGPIPEEVIERVREHYDIVDVVGRYVQLKKSGSKWLIDKTNPVIPLEE